VGVGCSYFKRKQAVLGTGFFAMTMRTNEQGPAFKPQTLNFNHKPKVAGYFQHFS
jgi:hypothetical protein